MSEKVFPCTLQQHRSGATRTRPGWFRYQRGVVSRGVVLLLLSGVISLAIATTGIHRLIAEKVQPLVDAGRFTDAVALLQGQLDSPASLSAEDKAKAHLMAAEIHFHHLDQAGEAATHFQAALKNEESLYRDDRILAHRRLRHLFLEAHLNGGRMPKRASANATFFDRAKRSGGLLSQDGALFATQPSGPAKVTPMLHLAKKHAWTAATLAGLGAPRQRRRVEPAHLELSELYHNDGESGFASSLIGENDPMTLTLAHTHNIRGLEKILRDNRTNDESRPTAASRDGVMLSEHFSDLDFELTRYTHFLTVLRYMRKLVSDGQQASATGQPELSDRLYSEALWMVDYLLTIQLPHQKNQRSLRRALHDQRRQLVK